jgi:hypothetical protein
MGCSAYLIARLFERASRADKHRRREPPARELAGPTALIVGGSLPPST